MKRHIAGSYANTNIMHSSAFDGIQERVRAFVKYCEEARKEPYIDFYVKTTPSPDCGFFDKSSG